MDIPLVVPIDWMDDETFLIHFEKRHADALPGMDGFINNVHGSTVNSYRIFHDTIHRLLPLGEPHEHEEVYEHE
jgi:hypothetical protein